MTLAGFSERVKKNSKLQKKNKKNNYYSAKVAGIKALYCAFM